MPATPERECDVVSNEGLLSLLRNESRSVVVLDCRSSNEYGDAHVRGAVNFSIPSIMLRRLAAGKIDLASTIKCRELKQKISAGYKENLFVLYNDLSAAQHHQGDSVLGVLLRRLTQDGCRVACLEAAKGQDGVTQRAHSKSWARAKEELAWVTPPYPFADGFPTFRSSFPEWCDSCAELLEAPTPASGNAQDALPLMGLRSLRISAPSAPAHHRPHRSCDSLSSAANSSTDSSDTDDRCDSSLGLEDDREFPVEILPYLFLGNAANSEDSQALAKHSIQYVLNVTPDLPNVFEDQGSMKYMQIPITDHWSQNLASHFPKAIEFIDEARNRQKGVLVHCLAGISRSVTITVAYLMYKCSLNLNDAFNVVRSRKSNIAPNFHFMEQLHNFERELKLDVSSQSPQPLMEQMEQLRREQQRNRDNEEAARRPQARKAARPCANCGLAPDGGCKCGEHGEFLSPLAHVGVSPDSGIEFDRWGTSATPGE